MPVRCGPRFTDADLDESIGGNAMSHTDRVFALIAVAVVLAFTVGLWMTNLL
jgi:hypothetical protein